MINQNIKDAYFNILDMENNMNSVRRMAIKLRNDLKCVLKINTPTCKPFITTPSSATMDQLALFEVEQTIGKYKEYTFYEDTITDLTKSEYSSLKTAPELNQPLTPELVTEYLETRKDAKGEPMNGVERYIPYLTVFNPVLKTDATIFIDKKHGDMFYIVGLKFLLDPAVDPATEEIELNGYAIGGRIDQSQQAQLTGIVTPSYKYQYGGVPPAFGKNMKFTKSDLHQPDPDVKAYGVIFTKELPSNTATNSYPIVYDKVMKGATEIQVARQDGFPSVVVQLGKLSKFFDGPAGKVHGWLLYCGFPTRVNLKPNKDIEDSNAILSFVIDLY